MGTNAGQLRLMHLPSGSGSHEPAAPHEATRAARWEVQVEGSHLVACVAISPDGSLVAIGSGAGTWNIWDAVSGSQQVKAQCCLMAHAGVVKAITFSPCGKRLCTGYAGGAVVVWDVATGECEMQLPGTGEDTVWTVAFSEDGALLVAADNDGCIRAWEAPTCGGGGWGGGGGEAGGEEGGGGGGGWPCQTIDDADVSIYSVAFSPDSAILASAGWEGSPPALSPSALSPQPSTFLPVWSLLDEEQGSIKTILASRPWTQTRNEKNASPSRLQPYLTQCMN